MEVETAAGCELAHGMPSNGLWFISSWALATTPQKDRLWPMPPFVWEASDPYIYLRATPDGRVIWAGEDEDFSDEAACDALTPDKIARISEKLARLPRRLDPTPEFAWAGTFTPTL